jgi:hypothetical protein
MKSKLNAKWLLVILLITPLLLQALPTKVSGEYWGRWTNEMIKAADGKDKTSKNYFSLERGYFGLETAFTPNTKGRFNIDLFSSDSDADANGAGIKLKYAYVDFANLMPVHDMNLTVGLQKVYFGTIYDWDYTVIGKAPTDEYKVVNSSDYGLNLNGYLPKGLGEYQLGLYNGEGYKKTGSALADNTQFSYLANVRLTPVGGLTLGGSYMSNSVKREKALADDSPVAAYEEQSLMDGVLRLNYSIVDFWGEFISKDRKFPNVDGSDYTATGFMIMPIISLGSLIEKDIQIIVRYDQWDETDNPSETAQYLMNATTIGANYNFFHDEKNVPAMQLQLNYTMKSYDEDESSPAYADGAKDSSQIMLQLKWRYSSTISD